MSKDYYDGVLVDDYAGIFARFTTTRGEVEFRRIKNYPTHPRGSFPVKVDDVWYACMLSKHGRILIKPKDGKIEQGGLGFRLSENGDSCTLTPVACKAERVAFIVRGELSLVFLIDENMRTPLLMLQNYPDIPSAFFILCFDDENYVLIQHGKEHVAVQVRIPEAFTYEGKTYVVTSNGAFAEVEHAGTTGETFLCRAKLMMHMQAYKTYTCIAAKAIPAS